MHNRRTLLLTLLMILMMAVLVACGGDDGDDDAADSDEPLPTIADDNGAADGDDPAAVDVTDEAPAGPPVSSGDSVPPFDPSGATVPEETPPFNAPGASGPPISEPGNDSVPPFDPSSGGAVPPVAPQNPDAGVADPFENTTTDFSDLTLDEFVRLEGTVGTLDTNASEGPLLTLSDEQGNMVVIGGGVPVPMLASFEGEIVVVEGTLMQDENDMLTIAASAMFSLAQPSDVPDFLGSESPPAGPGNAPGLPTGPNFAPPGAPADQGQGQIERTALDFTVDENLSVLGAYDALAENVDGLADLIWVATTGNPENQWVFNFLEPETNVTQDYIVAVTGEVFIVADRPGLPIPAIIVETGGIDRAAVVVDSSDVLEMIEAEGNVILNLSATPGGTVEWIVPGQQTGRILATEPQ